MSATSARPVQTGLLGVLVLALAGVVFAAVEGRAGWVYTAVGVFMAAGVALAIHTALVASQPRNVMRAAGFAPTRAGGVWRAIIDGVPIEVQLRDRQAVFRAEDVPDGLVIEAGEGGQPTGAPDFDRVIRCAGRKAWLAAIGPELRAMLGPLLALDARVAHGTLTMPMGGVEAVQAAAQTTAAMAQTYRDLRAALVDRARRDPPADGGTLAFAALAAGWPDDRATATLGGTLLQHAEPAVRLLAAEALGPRALDALAQLQADASLSEPLRVRAFVARVSASSGGPRRRVLLAGARSPVFAARARALAATHGVSLEESDA